MATGPMSYILRPLVGMAVLRCIILPFMAMGPMPYILCPLVGMAVLRCIILPFMATGPMSYILRPGSSATREIHLLLERRSKTPQLRQAPLRGAGD